MEEKEKVRRQRGQLIPLGPQPGYQGERQDFGIRVPLKERGKNGRNKSHYETIRNVTPFQAEKVKERLLAKVDAGEFHIARAITVKDFAAEWLKHKESHGLKESTIYSYGDTIRCFITPYIGHLMLGDVKGRTVRDLYTSLQKRGLTSGTILQSAHVLRQMFKDAKTWDDIRDNPTEGIKAPPGAKGREAHVFEPEQALKLIQACSEDLKDLIFVLDLATGLRPRELTGLTRPHLKLVRQEVEGKTVERGVVEVRQIAFKQRGGGWIFTPPKTKKSIRDVPFPAPIYHALMAYQEQVDRRKALMGKDWKDYNLVFPSPRGTPLHFDSLRKTRFKTVLKRAGLPTHFTFYSFRYSFATLQMLGGERDKVIADLMGHTRVDFNQEVYQKVIPRMRERASDRMENLLFEDSCTMFAQLASEREM